MTQFQGSFSSFHKGKKQVTVVANNSMSAWLDDVKARNVIVSKREAEDWVNSLNSAMFVREELDFDVYDIHCSKTGQPIGRRSENDIQLLIRVHGVSKASELARFQYNSHPAQAWIKTDSGSLERLQELDPIGFYTYACNLAFIYQAQGYQQFKFRFDTLENQILHAKQVTELWYKVKKYSDTYGIQKIMECNKAWQIFLSVCKPVKLPKQIQFNYSMLDCGDADRIAEHADNLFNMVERAAMDLKLRRATYQRTISTMRETYGHNSATSGMKRKTGEKILDSIQRQLENQGFDIAAFNNISMTERFGSSVKPVVRVIETPVNNIPTTWKWGKK